MTAAGDERSDWELIEATASGDPDAFEVIVRRHDRLLRTIIVRHGSRVLKHHPLDAVVNETWYQALRRALARRFNPSLRFTTWLWGLCRNVLRQKQFRPPGPSLTRVSPTGDEFVNDPPAPQESPAEIVAGAERDEAVRHCVAQRPQNERRAYELTRIDGLTVVAAASRLGCSEAYLRQTLLPRLHEAVRRCLARKGFRDVDFGAPG